MGTDCGDECLLVAEAWTSSLCAIQHLLTTLAEGGHGLLLPQAKQKDILGSYDLWVCDNAIGLVLVVIWYRG